LHLFSAAALFSLGRFRNKTEKCFRAAAKTLSAFPAVPRAVHGDQRRPAPLFGPPGNSFIADGRDRFFPGRARCAAQKKRCPGSASRDFFPHNISFRFTASSINFGRFLMKKAARASLLAAVFLLGLAVPAPAGVVKIGLMCPLTGPSANEGQDMRKVVELLAEELNKKGGIRGDRVEIAVEDDGSDPRTAALAAQRLSTSGVTAVIGTYGSAVTEASQGIYDEAGIVQVATGSTSVRLTSKGYKLFFRTSPRDDDQGRVLADAVRKLGAKKLAILHDNSAYAKGLGDEVRGALNKLGGVDIVFYDAIKPREQDYTAALTKIKGSGPDLLLFTGYYGEAGLLLRQMRELQWKVPMLGGDAANNMRLVDIAGREAAAGYRFVSPPMPGDLDSAQAKNFLAAYSARYKSLPGSIWPVAGGDALLVLVQAMQARGAKAADIAAYLHGELKDFPGLTGPVSFDAKGDRIGDIYRLYEVDREGRFVLQPK
jgi:branched-chain amino acid transport system substrate-binding protein